MKGFSGTRRRCDGAVDSEDVRNEFGAAQCRTIRISLAGEAWQRRNDAARVDALYSALMDVYTARRRSVGREFFRWMEVRHGFAESRAFRANVGMPGGAAA